MDVPVGKLEQYAGHGWTSKKGTDKSPISVPSDEEASKRKNLKRTTSLKDAMKNSFKEKKGAKSVPSEQTQVNTERRGSAAERRGSNTERRGSKKERRVSEDRVSRASHDERRASQASRDGSTSLDRIGAKDGEGSRGPAVSGFTREFHRESAARDQNLTSWEELPRARKRKTTEHEKVVSLQSIVRSKVLYARRLHRRHLAERLLLEHSVMVGTCRLFYQLLMFVLFLSALRLVSDETRKRGIHRSLESALDFEAMEAIASRERFVTFGLQNIAEKSKQFSVMSSRYFATDGAGSVELASDMELYTVPKIGPSMALPLSRFSFSAWVRSTPQFISGYLVRKRPVPVGEDAGLACWGWYLHNQLGQGFHYGAQDYFPTAPQDLNQAKARQVEIGLSEANRHPPNEYVMLTVVVTEHRVTFYHNLRPLGAARLPRNITDCFNHGEGILIGDSGLELGIVRFHPRALTPSLIEELFSAGNVLSELSTGSTPFKPRDSELQEEARALRTSVTETRDAVADRRRESELGSILDAAKDYRNAGPPHALSPPAPLGSLLADETERRCNETGRDYYSLVQGPYVLTTTMSEQDHRKVVRMPNFAGTGATLSFWYRHQKCASTSCGVYLLQVRDDDRVHPATGEPAQICWSLWLENNAIWYDNVIGTPKYQYPTDFVEDRFELDGDVTWRHLAMVFDEDTDNVRYYMDGTLAWEGPWGASVRSADQGCTGPTRRMTLGRIEPGYTYGAEVEVFDLRMFVHNPVQGPLQDDDMAKLAGAPTPFVHPTSRCHPIESDAMADTDWKDYYGHGCEWYHDNRATHSALCHYPPAREQCPNACHSLQECFRTPKYQEEATFVVWDRIRRIEAKGPHGTICLGSEVDLPAVLAECRRRSSQEGGIAADPEAEAWLDSYIAKPGGSGNRGRRIDMRDCDAIEASVDQHCAFDSQIVKDFTKRMSENEGNYTMAFWVKPVGPQSKMEGLDRFYPSINWYGTLSPPQHNLALGRWENPNGEVRVFSSCGRGVRDIYENFEVEAADEEEWTLIVISRVNSLGSMSGMTVTNLARNWEGSETPQCLYDPDSLFTALEFNYDVLVSPIMLLPQTLPFARVQDLYFKSVRDLKSQHGPIDSERDRLLRDRIPVVKHNYHPRSILIAPPIIFTQRLQPSTQCPYAYSTKLIAQQHLKMQETVCQHPFVCASGSVLDHEPLFCTGPPQDTARVFGLDPIRYNDQVGYADLLHTITDAPFMSRDDKVRPTSDFVTNHMSAAEITLVFYTAEFGITSVVSIQGRFDRAPAASVSVKMDHYAILEGHDLMLFFIVYALVLALLLVMVYDLLTHLAEIISRRRRSIKSKWRDLGRAAFELLIVGVMVTYVAWRLPSAANSAAVTERTVGGLTNIPWDSTDMDLKEKKNKFFSILVDLLRETSTETQYGYLCVILLVLLLGRVIYCTGAHPRLAFLTGTLTKALDDLIHAACLLGLLMCSFAGIATWRFGSYRDEFGSLSESLQTQFLMLFGEFPEHWQANREIVLYTVMTIVLQFLIVQNFLLAIIVETYMKLRVNIEEMQTEQDFFTDVVNCVQSHLYSYWYGWPTPGVLGPVIDSWTARFSVGFNDLERTELFSSGQAVGAYLRYYGGYDFLRPVPISDYAMPHTQTKTMGEEIEYRLSKVIGKVPTLKELARESMEVVNERKQHLDGTVNRNLDGSVHSRDGTVISRTPVNGNGRANSLVRPLVRPRTSSPVSEASHRQLASIDVSGMRWEGIPVDPKRMIQRQQSHPGQHGSWKIRPEHHSSLGIVPRVPHQVEPAGSSGRRSSDLSSDTPPNLGPPPVTNAHVQSSAASHEEALATATMVGIPTAPSVAHLKKAAGGQGQGQLKEEAGGRKEGSAGGPEKEREVVAEEVRRQLSGLEERLLEELRRGEQRVAEREDQQAAMFEAVIAAVQQSLGNVALTPQTHAHTTADTTPRSQPAHTRHLPATFSPTGIAVLNDLDSASRSRSRFTPDTRFERIEVDLGVFHPAGTPPISPTWVAVQEQQEATLLDVDLGGGSGEDGEGASSSSVDDNGVGFC